MILSGRRSAGAEENIEVLLANRRRGRPNEASRLHGALIVVLFAFPAIVAWNTGRIPMKPRLSFGAASAAAYRAMMGLERAIHESGLEPKLVHLLKLRASQINGCAYCIDMHWKDARAFGETEQRLYGLPDRATRCTRRHPSARYRTHLDDSTSRSHRDDHDSSSRRSRGPSPSAIAQTTARQQRAQAARELAKSSPGRCNLPPRPAATQR